MNALKTQPSSVRAAGAGRPGAMTTAMQAVHMKPSGPKVLRVGVVRGGSIVDERVLRRRETFSVGTSEKNQLVLSDANLPARFALFELVGADYVLNFTESMGGRVGLHGSVQDLAQLRALGATRNAGTSLNGPAGRPYAQVKLNDNARGKVVIGDTTLLFQFVPPLAKQARPQLPAAVRGGFVRNVDWLFTAFAAVTLMSAFGFLVYLENYDAPIKNELAQLEESMAEILIIEPPVPEPVEPDPVVADEGDDASSEPSEQHATNTRDRTRDASPTPSSQSPSTSSAEAVASLTREAAQQAEALIAGALSASADGVIADLLAAGAVTGRAEDILAGTNGINMAMSASGGELRSRNTGGDGTASAAGIGALASAGGSDATRGRDETRQVIERELRGQARVEEGSDVGGNGEFDTATVVAMIKLRMGAIKACYERSLRQNPSLAGKVTVEFTIVPAGTVTAPSVASNSTGDDTVAQCVVTTLRSLRFKPGPVGGSVVYAYPFVFAPSQ